MATPASDQALVDRLQDRLDAGAEAALGIAAAQGERHLVADHLAHHVGRALGDERRMRDDDDADIRSCGCLRGRCRDAASTISALERAPGSMWPIERSPRKEARPRVAFIGMVASAARCARAATRPSVGAAGDRLLHGHEHVEHGLLAGIRLAARLHGVDRRLQRPGDGVAVGASGRLLPSAMNSVP